MIREYTYYPGVDRPHSVRAAHSGASYYYATDHPGNVVGLINAAQQLENEYRYVHFGEVQVVKENIPQPLRFAAREWDDIPGLYQVRARWYDPQSGRFVSEDPIGLAGGINPYVYANNDPINHTDPSGMCYKVTETTWLVTERHGKEESRVVISEHTYYVGDCTGGGGRERGGAQGRGGRTVRDGERANARRSNSCLARNADAHLRFGLFASARALLLNADIDILSLRLGTNTRFTSGVEVSAAGRAGNLGFARQSTLRKGYNRWRDSNWTGFQNSLDGRIGLGGGAIVGAEVSLDIGGYVDCLAKEASNER